MRSKIIGKLLSPAFNLGMNDFTCGASGNRSYEASIILRDHLYEMKKIFFYDRIYIFVFSKFTVRSVVIRVSNRYVFI